MTTDTGNQKLMAVLCYLGFLWIIPLLTDSKNDPFVKFHINQGIVLTLLFVAAMVINVIPILGQIISFIASIAGMVFAIMGIINATKMEEKPLPLIGGIQIYK